MLSRIEFAREFALKPGLNWIHVVSANGSSIGGETATSDDVSNPEDREFLFAMRAQSDAIFVSAKTAIAENYTASKFAPIFIIDRNLSPATAAFETIARDGKHSVTVVNSISEAFERLADGRSILLECGRTMARAAIVENNADVEISQAFVTVSTRDADLAAVVANKLLVDLGAEATISKQLVNRNVYSAYELQSRPTRVIT